MDDASPPVCEETAGTSDSLTTQYADLYTMNSDESESADPAIAQPLVIGGCRRVTSRHRFVSISLVDL